MSTRCAHCGDFNPRRSMQPPGEWVDYLVSERDATDPVGTTVIPLCRECYAEARDYEDLDDAQDFLDELDTDALVDDVAG
ncbi:hypothetical protein BRC81_10815 [Halobacteriales archaeon QS_1_68_20]|nr:MAG: hypothetical protein BRC81_10815 [Halobacteriales archaeon QS_1_68_20]